MPARDRHGITTVATWRSSRHEETRNLRGARGATPAGRDPEKTANDGSIGGRSAGARGEPCRADEDDARPSASGPSAGVRRRGPSAGSYRPKRDDLGGVDQPVHHRRCHHGVGSSTRQKPAEWTNTAINPTARNVTPPIHVMCQNPATIPTKAAAWAIA